MVATRPIKAFEPVVLDQALAFGPCEHTKPRCLACLKLLDEVSTVCPECNLPMCDLEVINVKLAVIVFACWTLANHRVGEKPKKEGAIYGSSSSKAIKREVVTKLFSSIFVHSFSQFGGVLF